MRLTLLPLLIGAAALAGCARDNPDNVPLHGQWEMTTRIGDLSVDGMVVPPDLYPPEFKALVKSEQRCGEPMFIDRDWQQDDINQHVKGDCTLTRYDVTPSTVTGKGQCLVDQPGADFSPALDIRIDQAPDNYRMTITLRGEATIKGQGRHMISATAIQDGVRKGDC